MHHSPSRQTRLVLIGCSFSPQPNFSVKPTPTSFACRFPPCCALRCGLPRALGLSLRRGKSMSAQPMHATAKKLQASPRIWHIEAMDSCIGSSRQSLAAFTKNHPRAPSCRPRASRSAARVGSRSLPSIIGASALGLGLTGCSTGRLPASLEAAC